MECAITTVIKEQKKKKNEKKKINKVENTSFFERRGVLSMSEEKTMTAVSYTHLCGHHLGQLAAGGVFEQIAGGSQSSGCDGGVGWKQRERCRSRAGLSDSLLLGRRGQGARAVDSSN